MRLQDCSFRNRYPEFVYHGYSIQKDENRIRLTFDFEIPGLCSFSPETQIDISNLELLGGWQDDRAKQLVFLLGMTECVSYFKAVCPRVLRVECGTLSEKDKQWWQKLYYNGLGEFLYRNDLQCSQQELIAIEAPLPEKNALPLPAPRQKALSIVPVGGGKDSAVTASLLHDAGKKVLYFTVNDQQARTDTVTAAGGSEKDRIRTFRTIDSRLLDLNRRGFLNGHTPFSAIVAFLSSYCAYLTGAENIILSNESSANESNIAGTGVNHQYSKSYEFEKDFSGLLREKTGADIRYFSLLRPFSELQIACYFASLPQYHSIFRSCNAGSRKNIWCGHCPKCLFVYCILAPFMEKEKLDGIFGGCMTDKTELREDFFALAGLSPVKPFECVGTVSELRCALYLTARRYEEQGIELPCLLREFLARAPGSADEEMLRDYNREHGVPEEFMPCVKEMYGYVSQSGTAD